MMGKLSMKGMQLPSRLGDSTGQENKFGLVVGYLCSIGERRRFESNDFPERKLR